MRIKFSQSWRKTRSRINAPHFLFWNKRHWTTDYGLIGKGLGSFSLISSNIWLWRVVGPWAAVLSCMGPLILDAFNSERYSSTRSMVGCVRGRETADRERLCVRRSRALRSTHYKLYVDSDWAEGLAPQPLGGSRVNRSY